jgi:CubicO group peptidase (beta-lactamase class C family)
MAGVPELVAVLEDEVSQFPGRAGVAVVTADGGIARAGSTAAFSWASVTKLVTALAVLDASHRGVVHLDAPAGPEGSTLRHLLAHASGLALDSDRVRARPGFRRIYSNRGFELAAQQLSTAEGRPFESIVRQRVLEPLGMFATVLKGSPAHGAVGPVHDLALLARELLDPRWFPTALVTNAVTPAFPDLDGMLPGFGRHSPNTWGLGFEVRAGKYPHWMSPLSSPRSFGHFGQSGSFLWVDPEAGVACVSAGDVPFGAWAVESWPQLSTRILRTAKHQPHWTPTAAHRAAP